MNFGPQIPGKATAIIGPALHPLGEFPAALAQLAVAALVVLAFRPPAAFGRRTLLMGLACLAYTALTILTIRAVFLLPFFFLVVPQGAEATGRPGKRPWFGPFLAAFFLGLGLAWLQAPETLPARLAAVLQPLLGSRWPANGLWLAAVALLATSLPCRRFPAVRPPTAGGLALCLLLTQLLLAAVYRWGLAGQEVFGTYLLWTSLPLLAFTALLIGVAAGRRWGLAGVLVALLAVIALGAWPRAGQGPPLNRVLDRAAPADLLLVEGDALRREGIRPPLDVAGTGTIRTFAGALPHPEDLRKARLDRFHPSVWILTRETAPRPWLPAALDPAGRPLELGSGGTPLVLHRVDFSRLPRPQALFPVDPAPGQPAQMQGLLEDGLWTGPRFRLEFEPHDPQAAFLDIRLHGWRPEAAGSLAEHLTVTANGRALPAGKIQKTYLGFLVPAGTLQPGRNVLVLEVAPYVPADVVPGSDDRRQLGLDLDTVILR